MNKLIITLALAIMAGASFSEVKADDKTLVRRDTKTELHNSIDSISYAMGIANSNGLDSFIKERYGVDQTNADDFIKGLNESVYAAADKKKAAYFAGIQIGQQIAKTMISELNQELFGEDTTKTISLETFMAGFISGYTGKGALMTEEEALTITQEKIEEIKIQEGLKQFAGNKAEGEKFLASNKNAAGVVCLPSGLQYKVIKQGTGAVPADTATVKVHYEGRLIDGTVFDSSYERGESAELRVDEVIEGWTEILQIMPVGSTYEVFVPQELGYGSDEAGDIKPFSCLIFKIELLGIVE